MQHLRRRGVRKETDLVHGEHVVPGPERLRQLRAFRRRKRLVAHRVEGHSGRQHQALLRAADGDVDAPFVVPVIGGGERGDGVDKEQGGVGGGVDRLANLRDRREAPGRGLVVQHADCFDFLVPVPAQMVLDCRRIGANAPIGLDEFRLQPEFLRHGLPQRGELPGLDHQHAIAG